MNAPVLASGTSSAVPSRRWASRFSTRSVRPVTSVRDRPSWWTVDLVLRVVEPYPAPGTLDVHLRILLDRRGQGEGTGHIEALEPFATRTTEVSSQSMALAR